MDDLPVLCGTKVERFRLVFRLVGSGSKRLIYIGDVRGWKPEAKCKDLVGVMHLVTSADEVTRDC